MMSSARKELTPFFLFSFFVALPMLLASLFIPREELRADSVSEPELTALPGYPKVTHVELAALKATRDIQEKKQQFFALLKPMVTAENQYILTQRRWLKELDLSALDEEQAESLRTLMIRYQVIEEGGAFPEAGTELTQTYSELLLKVNTLPVELVLVQAANESSWGQSRFAREGNNLFGQWCFSKGCGMIPKQRPKGSYHEVAVFDSPQLSIRAYLQNLNSFWAYDDLRQARSGRPDLTGKAQALFLADYLTRYSQRGQAYVRELKQMVQVNSPLIQAASQTDLR